MEPGGSSCASRVCLDTSGRPDEEGFSLVELMVVLLVIALLLVIAIPTFLSTTASANDRSAQSNLTNALTEVAAQYQAQKQTFAGVTTGLLNSSAPEFDWSPSTANLVQQTQIAVDVDSVDVAAVGDAEGEILATYSAPTQTCWFALVLEANPAVFIDPDRFVSMGGVIAGGTFYARHFTGSGARCDAAMADAGLGYRWGVDYATAPVN